MDSITAMQSYLKELPNGDVFAQDLGHPDKDSSQFTKFGTAFGAADHTWTPEFCKATFPGASMTNGEAFGDPCCTWKKGGKPDFTVAAFTTTPGKATVCASGGGSGTAGGSGTTGGSSAETPAGSSAETPSAETPSAETPSTETESSGSGGETPSAETPSTEETPSSGSGGETPSAETPSTDPGQGGWSAPSTPSTGGGGCGVRRARKFRH
ncbi:Hypothetical protein PHPALM_3592 [Phytophthora palmivora]|uniref:Temptin Cys/Cys disulfide domain-containing protein n=1 Tax=Phytophthora palmivora TaxID=4796 RepID=A0A2P4YM16_9STRA|nr:Hypothetical protein PHPALM_3592 [Phytophthora palmivora]